LYPKGISCGAYIELFYLASWIFELPFYEFGNFTNLKVYVELDIGDIGTFYFDGGDRGSKKHQ
jgi:hypothetical protein